ncbi:MAG: DUF5995 family protein [Actinomycetota bacterium]
MEGIDVSEIDAVIERLDAIIDDALDTGDRMGWFAAMYRRVTIAVRNAILAGDFEDGPRMARFDKIFADRFIAAWDHVRAGEQPTRSWQVAFDAAQKWRPVIVQQLLLGMNAHINLDLGIAAEAVAPGGEIDGLKNDFDTINRILSELTNGFVVQVDALSPWFARINRIAGSADDEIIKWSIEGARLGAWGLATDLARRPDDRAAIIAERDAFTVDLAGAIRRPGWVVLPSLLFLARLREPNDVDEVTRFLIDPPEPSR